MNLNGIRTVHVRTFAVGQEGLRIPPDLHIASFHPDEYCFSELYQIRLHATALNNT
jgi:hypothetical protein